MLNKHTLLYIFLEKIYTSKIANNMAYIAVFRNNIVKNKLNLVMLFTCLFGVIVDKIYHRLRNFAVLIFECFSVMNGRPDVYDFSGFVFSRVSS